MAILAAPLSPSACKYRLVRVALVCFVAFNTPIAAGREAGDAEAAAAAVGDRVSPSEQPSLFWSLICTCIALVAFAGMMSGLTVGLMSIDPLKLTIMTMEGSDTQKKNANIVSGLLKQHHLLLVTLLLANAAAMEALPLFLDRLVPSWMAVLLSVSLVLMFGEVIPQALCTKRPIAFGARFAWLVRFLLVLCWPAAYPIAKLLDCILGEHGHQVLFKRTELHALMGLHQGPSPECTSAAAASAPAASGDDHMRFLHDDEIKICQGALSLFHKKVSDVMTPFEDVFMVDVASKADLPLMTQIMAQGHTRIPVFRGGNRHNVIGMLLVTRLIIVDPDERRPIGKLVARRPMVVSPTDNLFQVLNEFQLGRSHLALVTNSVSEVSAAMRAGTDVGSHVRILGVVSIEDIVEELIQEEIEDEQDVLRAHVSALQARQHHANAHKAVLKAATMFKRLLDRARRRRGSTASARTSVASAAPMSISHEITLPLLQEENLPQQP